MEPEPIEHQPKDDPRNGHIFNNPKLPRYKDIVRDSGRGTLAEWESSVLFHIRPFIQKDKWTIRQYGPRVVASMRLMATRNETCKKVIDVWDTYDRKEKVRAFSLDKACDEAGVNRDEFAELVLVAVKSYFRAKAASLVELNLPELVQASVDYASKSIKEASPERIRHLEKHGIIDKHQPASTRINVQQNAPRIAARSFDSVMEDFDKVVDGEIVDEPKLIGDGK